MERTFATNLDALDRSLAEDRLRHSGSSPGEASDIVTEVWARVGMLGTSSDGPMFEPDYTLSAEEYALGQARPDRG